MPSSACGYRLETAAAALHFFRFRQSSSPPPHNALLLLLGGQATHNPSPPSSSTYPKTFLNDCTPARLGCPVGRCSASISELFQEPEPGLVAMGPWNLVYSPHPLPPRTEGDIQKVPVQRGSPLKSTHQRTPVLTIRLKLIIHVTSFGKWIMASHCLPAYLHGSALRCAALRCTRRTRATPYLATTSPASAEKCLSATNCSNATTRQDQTIRHNCCLNRVVLVWSISDLIFATGDQFWIDFQCWQTSSSPGAVTSTSSHLSLPPFQPPPGKKKERNSK